MPSSSRLVAVGLPLLAVLALPAAGGAAVAGGGSRRSDCYVEFEGLPSDRRSVRCTDGDGTCDADGIPNGRCRFVITPCLNVVDAKLKRCTPDGVTDFRVRKTKPGKPFSAALDRLERAVLSLGLP